MTLALPLFSAALLFPLFASGAIGPFARAVQCFMACGALLVLAARPDGLRGRPWPVLLALPAASLLSLILSPYKHSAVPGFLTEVSVAAFFAAVLHGGDAFRRAGRFLLPTAFLVTLAVHAWQAGAGGGFLQPWFNANVLAGVLLLLGPVALAELPGTSKALVLLAGLVLVQTGSVPAWFVFIAGAGTLLWFARKGTAPWPRGCWVAAVAAGAALFLAACLMDGDRRAWWEAGLLIFRGHPVMGVGPGAFGEAWPGVLAGWSGWNTLFAHNFIVERLAEGGLLGTGAFIALLVAVFRKSAFPPSSPAPAALWLGAVSFLIYNTIHVGFSIPGAAALFWVQMAWLCPEPAGAPWPAWSRGLVIAGALAVSFLAFRVARADVILDRAVGTEDPAALAALAEEGARWAPWEPEFLSLRGRAHAAAGRMAEARADLQRAAAMAPSSARFQAELGDVSEALGDKPSALACFRRAVRFLPLQPLYWMRLSELSEGKESEDAALRTLSLLTRQKDVYTRVDPALRAGLIAAARRRTGGKELLGEERP